jgi:hypothetical protein
LPSVDKHRWWRRRARYAIYKALIIASRLRDVLWRSAIAFAIACGVATIAIIVDGGRTFPLWIYPLPFIAWIAYTVLIGSSRFVRTWRSFHIIRNERRMERLAALRDGGVRTQRYRRLTLWRVWVSIYAVTYGGAIAVAVLLPKPHTTLQQVLHYGLLVGVVTAGMILEMVLVSRSERDRPNEFDGYCPRCSYDLSASPERCPECGLARSAIERAKKQTRWFKR